MNSEWLIPWRKRGESGPVRDNLLWRHGPLYVMDNHRLALWCWWQHLADSPYWHFLHIDRHYDALWQQFDPWPKHWNPSHTQDLQAFRRAKFRSPDDHMDFELYRWDVVTSALWSLHKDELRDVVFATADDGDQPLIPRANHIDAWKLPGTLAYYAEPDRHLQFPCIVDIDLDYFTRADSDNRPFSRVFSNEYIRDIGSTIRLGLERGMFGVVTIALSPETTGGWELAERLLGTLLHWLPEYEKFARGAPKPRRYAARRGE